MTFLGCLVCTSITKIFFAIMNCPKMISQCALGFELSGTNLTAVCESVIDGLLVLPQIALFIRFVITKITQMLPAPVR